MFKNGTFTDMSDIVQEMPFYVHTMEALYTKCKNNEHKELV